MGAFGIRTFETDDATEWMESFAQAPSSVSLRKALELGQHPDKKASRLALAAAEVVAAWCGRPAPEIPPSVTAWLLGRTQAVNERALLLAREAVDRVLSDSALRDSWEECGGFEAWRSAVVDLRHRLGD
jgi:uncharacterized protein DUF4259